MKFLSVMFCIGVLCSSVSLMGSTDSFLSLSSEGTDSGSSIQRSSSVGRKFSIESCVSRGVESVEKKLEENFPIKDIIIEAAVVDADIDFFQDIPRIKEMHKKVENYFVMRGITLDEYLFASIFYPSDLLLTSADFTTLFSSSFYMQKINAAFVRGISLKKNFSNSDNLAYLISHYVQGAKNTAFYEEYYKKALVYCVAVKNNELFYKIVREIQICEVENSFFSRLYGMFLTKHPLVYSMFDVITQELEEDKKSKSGVSRDELISEPLSTSTRRISKRLGHHSDILLPWVMAYVSMKRFALPFDEDLSGLRPEPLLEIKRGALLKIAGRLKENRKDTSFITQAEGYRRYLKLNSSFTKREIDVAYAAKMQDFEAAASYIWSQGY